MDFLGSKLEGGAPKKRKAVHKKKPAAKKAAPSAWKSTGRKVVVKGAQRSVYRNASTGKLAYRKRVAGANGKPGTLRYCAVPTTGMRGGTPPGVPPSLSRDAMSQPSATQTRAPLTQAPNLKR